VCLRLASQPRQSAGFFYGDRDFFLSLNCPECKTVHKITNAKLFLENMGGYFFHLGKTLNWVVLGVFHGDRDFYDLLEKPSNYPIKSFALLKQ